MLSLFSSFDYFYFSINLMIFLFFMPLLFCLNNLINFVFCSSNLIFVSMSAFFHTLNKNYFSEILFIVIFNLMTMILYLNVFSIFPFIFAFNSHPSMVMFFSFTFWLCLFFMQIFHNLKGFLSHCIPEGAPIYLSVFLFLIELVSNSIRPLTLGVRLCANILAGHLLMILLSKLVLSFFLMTPLYMLLNVVEFFVSVIQSYIFVTLLTLYFSEVK